MVLNIKGHYTSIHERNHRPFSMQAGDKTASQLQITERQSDSTFYKITYKQAYCLWQNCGFHTEGISTFLYFHYPIHRTFLDTDKSCSLLLMINLAEPEILPADCGSKLIRDIVCKIPSRPQKTYSPPKYNYSIFHKQCILTESTCHIFIWYSLNTTKLFPKNNEVVDINSIQKYKFLFDATTSTISPFLSQNSTILIKYIKYGNIYQFRTAEITQKDYGGYIIQNEGPKDFMQGLNLLNCSQNRVPFIWLSVQSKL